MHTMDDIWQFNPDDKLSMNLLPLIGLVFSEVGASDCDFLDSVISCELRSSSDESDEKTVSLTLFE